MKNIDNIHTHTRIKDERETGKEGQREIKYLKRNGCKHIGKQRARMGVVAMVVTLAGQ